MSDNFAVHCSEKLHSHLHSCDCDRLHNGRVKMTLKHTQNDLFYYD